MICIKNEKYSVRQFSPLQLFYPPLYQSHMNPLTDTELFSQIAKGDEKCLKLCTTAIYP